jgi:hypothetical protein
MAKSLCVEKGEQVFRHDEGIHALQEGRSGSSLTAIVTIGHTPTRCLIHGLWPGEAADGDLLLVFGQHLGLEAGYREAGERSR